MGPTSGIINWYHLLKKTSQAIHIKNQGSHSWDYSSKIEKQANAIYIVTYKNIT